MVLSEHIGIVNGSAPSAGPLSINAGALETSKIRVERAFLELPLNAIDAGNTRKVNAVDIVTEGFNPLHPRGSDTTTKCIVVFSNTMVPEGKMEAAMNYGTTKGTDEGHSNQSDGNHFGVGLKEAAIAFGGTPCMINMTQTSTKGQYVMTGTFVDKKVGECYQHIKGDAGKVVCKASFRAIVTDREGAYGPDVVILYPKSTDQLDKTLLYHSGLDFCVEGSRFDQCDMALQSDKMVAKNMDKLEETIANTFIHTMERYRDEQISRLMKVDNLLLTERYNNDNSRSDSEIAQKKYDLLLGEFSSITMCCMLGIDTSYLKRCSSMQSGMGEKYDDKIQAHILGLTGSMQSLSTQIASKINFDYYREDKGLECRDIFITLNGSDVRESNPYTPIACISKAIKNTDGPKEMRYQIPISATDPETNKTIEYGTFYLAKSDDWCGTAMVDMMAKQVHGMPSIETLEDGQTQVTWPGYDEAENRAPPPGILFEVDGVVYNPNNPTCFFENLGSVLNIPNVQKSTAPYSRGANPESGLRSGAILHTDKIFKDLFTLTRMNMKDKETKSPLTPAEAENKLNLKMFRNHMNRDGRPKPYLEQVLCTKLSCRVVEFLTCSKAHLDEMKLVGFPEEDSVAAKWAVQSVYGMNVSGIFRFNKDAMVQTVDKTIISLAINSQFGADALLREMRLAMICFSVNFCLSRNQCMRMKHIKANVDETPPSEFSKRRSESETSTVPVGYQTAAIVSPTAALHPIVQYNGEQSESWDDMSLEDWVTNVTHTTKPVDGINKTIDKMSTRDGWKVFWESSNRQAGMVKYFAHPKLIGIVTVKGIRTHESVFQLDEWLRNGGVDNVSAYPRSLVSILLNKDDLKNRVLHALGMSRTVRQPPQQLVYRRVRQRTDSGDSGEGHPAGSPIDMDTEVSSVPDRRSEKVNDQFFRAWRSDHISLEQTPDPPFIFYDTVTSISKDRIGIAIKYSKIYNSTDKPELKKVIKDILGISMRKTDTVEGKRLLEKITERVAAFDEAERQLNDADAVQDLD